MLTKNIKFLNFDQIKRKNSLEKKLISKLDYYASLKLLKSFSKNYKYSFKKKNCKISKI